MSALPMSAVPTCVRISDLSSPTGQVCAEGRFIVEFTFDDLMRIKSWHFATRGVKELIPRSVVSLHMQQDPGLVEQLSKNITRQGLTNVTLNYLRVSCSHPAAAGGEGRGVDEGVYECCSNEHVNEALHD